MAMVNLIAIALLGKVAYAALQDYNRQRKTGIMDPTFDPKVLPDAKGISCWPAKKADEING